MKHIPAIDGLRAIAVLSVVAYHAGAPAGFVGVDVFFVISGYLITGVLLERPPLVEFYARRARRILPAAFLCVLVTLALSFALLPSAGDVARSAASAGLFVANVFFQHATGDYWSDSADTMPLLHLWSLSVEEQFYLLWPLLLLAGRRWLPWVAGISLALFAWWSYADPSAAFYQMPARAWELAAGGLIAAGYVRPIRFGLPLVLLACLVPMPHWVAVPVAVLGSTFLIASIHAGRSVRVLEARPLVYVGLISYSLYLWHWPLLALDKAAGGSSQVVRLELVGIAFVLAILSYRYVETPFRRMRTSPRRAVAVGVACAALIAATGFTVAVKSPPPIKPPEIKRLACEGVGVLSAPSCFTTQRKMVLWGDSYLTAWSIYAQKLARQEGLPIATFFDTGCYPTAGEAIKRHNPTQTRTCREQNDRAIAYIRKNGAEVVVLTSYYAEFFRNHPGHPGLRDLVTMFPKTRFVIVGPTPEPKDKPERCAHKECGRTKGEFLAMSRDARAALAEVDRLPNVEVVDPTDYFCTDFCPMFRDGVPLYDNPAHVTMAAVRGFTGG
jgi:peptidoglycan/LPS O-acetylase OafA/YrhL